MMCVCILLIFFVLAVGATAVIVFIMLCVMFMFGFLSGYINIISYFLSKCAAVSSFLLPFFCFCVSNLCKKKKHTQKTNTQIKMSQMEWKERKEGRTGSRIAPTIYLILIEVFAKISMLLQKY